MNRRLEMKQRSESFKFFSFHISHDVVFTLEWCLHECFSIMFYLLCVCIIVGDGLIYSICTIMLQVGKHIECIFIALFILYSTHLPVSFIDERNFSKLKNLCSFIPGNYLCTQSIASRWHARLLGKRTWSVTSGNGLE